METVQGAIRTITSKQTKRAVVNIALLTAGISALFFLAAIASALFFQNFVPDQVLSVPIYLQYGSGPHPYGVASLTSPWLKTAQDYDVSVTLSVPPSTPNVEQGNFMMALHLLDQDVKPGLVEAARKFSNNHHRFDGYNIIFSSRRPALVPYVDPIVSVASRVLFLFYYILVPGSQTNDVTVYLAERLAFAKGSDLPAAAYLEVEAGQSFQTYQVWLNFTAQLRGLRWLMYHYRLVTYVAFTLLFWACEVLFMALVWMVWIMRTSPPDGDDDYYKLHGRPRMPLPRTRLDDSEEEDGGEEHSDDSNDAVSGRQISPKSEPRVKEEEEEDDDDEPLPEAPPGDGDDDDGDDGEYDSRTQRESGVGTSYSREGAGQVRQRPSRLGDE